MNGTQFEDPIAVCLAHPDEAILAVIAGVDGPSYRPLGACMTVLGKKQYAGTLSSGCVEADICLHALEAKEAQAPKTVRYGKGSPFFDIQLPCGGGLDILLLPNPQMDVLRDLQDRRDAREPVSLCIDMTSGAMSLHEEGATAREGDTLTIRFEPEPRFLVFGKGPEAATFAALVEAAGYPNLLLSPDTETLQSGTAAGCTTQHLKSAQFPDDLAVDHRTAVVLFFHDHEWEPPILMPALQTDAFYIGAQGSHAANAARLETMRTMGASDADITRLTGPVGLIPSARDARTLAISVLSEVLHKLNEARA